MIAMVLTLLAYGCPEAAIVAAFAWDADGGALCGTGGCALSGGA